MYNNYDQKFSKVDDYNNHKSISNFENYNGNEEYSRNFVDYPNPANHTNMQHSTNLKNSVEIPNDLSYNEMQNRSNPNLYCSQNNFFNPIHPFMIGKHNKIKAFPTQQIEKVHKKAKGRSKKNTSETAQKPICASKKALVKP